MDSRSFRSITRFLSRVPWLFFQKTCATMLDVMTREYSFECLLAVFFLRVLPRARLVQKRVLSSRRRPFFFSSKGRLGRAERGAQNNEILNIF